jgi:hypothetical protein
MEQFSNSKVSTAKDHTTCLPEEYNCSYAASLIGRTWCSLISSVGAAWKDLVPTRRIKDFEFIQKNLFNWKYLGKREEGRGKGKGQIKLNHVTRKAKKKK